MSNLIDVTENELITADRQNLINQYIEHGTHRINTLSLNIGGTETISSGRIGDFLGLSIGNFNGILKATNGTVSVATLNTDYIKDLSIFTTDNLTDTADNRFTNDVDIARLANTSGSNTGDQDLSPFELLSNKSTNTSLGTSDTLYPSQNAVKVYADNVLGSANALVYKGVIDCSTNPNYPAADAGHLYVVSVDGKIGGVSGIDVEVGDMCICNTDGTASGDQATVGTKWNVIQKNIVGAVTGPASSTNNNVAFFDGVTGKVIKDSGLTLSGTNTGDQTLPVNLDFNLSDLGDVDDTDKAEGKILKVNSAGTHIYVTDEIGTDEKVKYDVSDLSAGYIADKFVAGSGISLAEGTSANENKLVITNNDKGSDVDLSGLVPYTGATTNVYLGSNDLDTTGDITAGTFNSGTLSGNNSGDQDLSGLVSLDQTTPQSVINGSISVITPTSDYHIATKKYVDDAIVAAIDDSWDGSY